MADEDVLGDIAEARAAYDADVDALDGLDADTLETVDQWHEQADPETFETEHDDTIPKLTDDEWAYVIEVSV